MDLFPAAANSFLPVGLSTDDDQNPDRNRAPDIVLRGGTVTFPPPELNNTHRFQIARERAWLYWPGVGAFYLRAGHEIIVAAAPDVAPNTLSACLSGPVLAIALYQRGFLLLHASAVALRQNDGEWDAVGFLGRSGEGKSTLAASLHARGHLLLADDFIAVPLTADALVPTIAPGVAQLNLWPNSLQALNSSSPADTEWPQLWAHEDKRVRRIESGFATQVVPLRKLYVLETVATPQPIVCQSLSPAQALTQLVEHSYCAGFLPPAEMARQFKQSADLIQRVPVRRLQRPRDLNQLDAVAQIIETDFHNGSQ